MKSDADDYYVVKRQSEEGINHLAGTSTTNGSKIGFYVFEKSKAQQSVQIRTYFTFLKTPKKCRNQRNWTLTDTTK
jgi:hypothetical protein